jgi:hypothetical protein
MRSIRKTMIGLAVAATLLTACPGNEDETDTSPGPVQSGTTGATGTVTGELTGPVGATTSTGA